nr:hypothetical transcript [Hymenolepis microstoma]
MCSRVVALPTGKTEPMIFSVGGNVHIQLSMGELFHIIKIRNDTCYIGNKSIGEPCYKQKEYVNITINDVTNVTQLHVEDNSRLCVANFAPKCQFKDVEEGDVIPEASFPFARFEGGSDSVKVNFSVKRSEYEIRSQLYKDGDEICSWNGINVDTSLNPRKCNNLRENKAKGQLDYIFEYKRKDKEERTDFSFSTRTSGVGVTVYWSKKGPSPDVIECEKALATTSSEALATTSSAAKQDVQMIKTG